MQYIDIFLASSVTDLHLDRMELGNYIRELNDRFISRDIYFRLHMCEAFSDEIALTRKQDQYNTVIEKCDYFYIIVWNKIGQYTREEFDVALNQFQKTGSPRISTFFKATNDRNADVLSFMEELDKNLQHYYTRFSEIDTVKLKLLLQLSDCTAVDTKLEMKDSLLWMDGQPIRNINLENIPFYGNHEAIGQLQQELAKLNQSLAEAKTVCLANMDDESAWQQVQSIGNQRDAVLRRLHECEMHLLKTSMQLLKLTDEGKYVTARTKEAIRRFEAGQLDAALEILDEQEREQELAKEEELAEQNKRRLDAYLEEYLLKINLLKAKGCPAETEREIISLYEKARTLARKYRLDYACILDFVWFLRDQKIYTYATEVGDKLYYELKGMDHVEEVFWAKVCNDLGILYRDVDRMDEAESLLKEAYMIRGKLAEQDPDSYNADFAYTCNSLGILYRLNNRMEEAEPVYYVGLEILRRLSQKNLILHGGDHANICNNLAYMYYRTRQYARAEALYWEAHKIRTELNVLEPNAHEVYIGRIHNNLGDLYCASGRMSESEQHLKQGLELRLSSAQNNPVYLAYAAGSYTSLGILYDKCNRLEEAETAIKEAITIYRRHTKENFYAYGSFLASNLSRLGNVYRKMRRMTEAEELLEEAISIYQRLVEKVPTEHGEGLAQACYTAGLLFKETDRFEDAKTMLQKAHTLFCELADRIPEVYTEDVNETADFLNAMC